MKPKLFILMAVVTTIGLSASAQKQKTTEPVTKIIRLPEAFTSLIIDNDVSVVLTESNSQEIIVKGDERQIKKVSARTEDGRLFLSYMQSNERADIKVFVPAKLLTKIAINGKSEITSASILSNPIIRVVIGGESKVYLRSSGKILVEGTDEYDFVRVVR